VGRGDRPQVRRARRLTYIDHRQTLPNASGFVSPTVPVAMPRREKPYGDVAPRGSADLSLWYRANATAGVAMATDG
jgi:hypothetical protein